MKKILSEGDRIRQLNRFLNEAELTDKQKAEMDVDDDNDIDADDLEKLRDEKEVEEGLGTAIKKVYHGNREKHHARKAIDAQNFLTKGREQRKSGSPMDKNQTYKNRKKAGENLKKHDASYVKHRDTLKNLSKKKVGESGPARRARRASGEHMQDVGGSSGEGRQSKPTPRSTHLKFRGSGPKRQNDSTSDTRVYRGSFKNLSKKKIGEEQSYTGPYADRTSDDKKKEDAANKRLRDKLDKKEQVKEGGGSRASKATRQQKTKVAKGRDPNMPKIVSRDKDKTERNRARRNSSPTFGGIARDKETRKSDLATKGGKKIKLPEEIKKSVSYGFTKNGKLMYKGSKAKSMQLMKSERKSDPSAAYQLVYSQHLPKPGNYWPAGGMKKEGILSNPGHVDGVNQPKWKQPFLKKNRPSYKDKSSIAKSMKKKEQADKIWPNGHSVNPNSPKKKTSR